jgi:glycosyltransferase involved in cell wall biosynthesis
LQERLEQVLNNNSNKQEKVDYRATVAKKYNWDKIAQQTIAVYEKVLA